MKEVMHPSRRSGRIVTFCGIPLIMTIKIGFRVDRRDHQIPWAVNPSSLPVVIILSIVHPHRTRPQSRSGFSY